MTDIAKYTQAPLKPYQPLSQYLNSKPLNNRPNHSENLKSGTETPSRDIGTLEKRYTKDRRKRTVPVQYNRRKGQRRGTGFKQPGVYIQIDA